MLGSRYRFITHWEVDGPVEEVFRVIEDSRSLPRWWPAVWLHVEVIEPEDSDGLGQVIQMTSKGWLPYILHWTGRTVEKAFPYNIALEVSGDFVGNGRWTFKEVGSKVKVEYLWEIEVQKPLVRYASFLLRPLFCGESPLGDGGGRKVFVWSLPAGVPAATKSRSPSLIRRARRS